MTLKSIVKFFLIVVLSVAALGYLTYATSWFNWRQMVDENTPEFTMPDFPWDAKFETLEPVSQPIYKWRENGRWVYGETPPVGAEAIKISTEELE